MMDAAAKSSSRQKAWVAFPNTPYTGDSAIRAAQKVLGQRGWQVEAVTAQRGGNDDAIVAPDDADLYLADYDLLPFEDLYPGSERLSRVHAKGGKAPQLSSYVIRKSLIRKNYLAHSLHVARVKGLLGRAEQHASAENGEGKSKSTSQCDIAPATWAFEAACADDLDELLADDLYDVRDALESNNGREAKDRKWFIVKPAMADQGMGIRLFDSVESLQAIFREFEDDSSDEEGEESEAEEGVGQTAAAGPSLKSSTAVVTSQVRHFVIQEYLSNPLLIRPPGLAALHKFHIRAYVLAQGNLRVFLYNEMLALFAATPYQHPGTNNKEGDRGDHDNLVALDLSCHLTNTSRQDNETSSNTVHLLGNLQGCPMAGNDTNCLTNAHLEQITRGAASVIGDAFAACAQADRIHFQPWPHAWELFGVDLMVTMEQDSIDGRDALRVWLLEINAQPDFAKTGARLQATIDKLFERSLGIAVLGLSGDNDDDEDNLETRNDRQSWPESEVRGNMTLCLDMRTSAGGW